MICGNRKIIFVHIPKCGGTSVEDIIWTGDKSKRTEAELWMGMKYPFWRPIANKYQTGGLQHLTALQIRTEVGAELFASCYRFALVREPLSRLVSQYKYMKRRKDLRRFVKMGLDDSFSRYLDLIQAREHVQWKPQWEFLLDETGRFLVDDIYRLEDISKDMRKLSGHVGLDLEKLPHLNTTAEVEKPVVTEEDKQRVKAIYARDFELLGYPV